MKRCAKMLLWTVMLVAPPAFAHDDTGRTAVGGGIGGALGAVIGQEVGDRNGAIIGAAVGAALGTAAATRERHDRYEDRRYRGGRDGFHVAPHARQYDRSPRGRGGFCPPGLAKQGRC